MPGLVQQPRRGFPVPALAPLPHLFSTEQPKDPFAVGHHFTKTYDPDKALYFLSRYFCSHFHSSLLQPVPVSALAQHVPAAGALHSAVV